MAGHQRHQDALSGPVALMWWHRYIGMPFGRGTGQHQCWSLVRAVYRDVLSVDLPIYGDVAAGYLAAVEAIRSGTVKIADLRAAQGEVKRAMTEGQAESSWFPRGDDLPQPFDVVLMTMGHDPGRRCGHVGIVADGQRMLHTEATTGAIIVDMRHVTVQSRILGYRIHESRHRRLS